MGNVLGESPGIFHVGELRYLWDRNLGRAGTVCGCGVLLHECTTWRGVLEEYLRDDWHGAELAPTLPEALESVQQLLRPDEVAELQRMVVSSRRIGQLLFGSSKRRDSNLFQYAGILSRLYAAIARTTDTSVIVDSSKWPADAALLRHTSGVNPFFVHVIRDPRGVVLSRQRRVARRNGHVVRLDRTHLIHDSVGWLATNLAAELVCIRMGWHRCVQIRYEDFVRHPWTTVHRIASLIDHQIAHVPFNASDRTTNLSENHTVGGNRSRFRRGPIEIREDGRWRSQLPRADAVMTAALTSPLLRHYGYRMFA
jgi:hypothetical protein